MYVEKMLSPYYQCKSKYIYHGDGVCWIGDDLLEIMGRFIIDGAEIKALSLKAQKLMFYLRV